MIAALRGLLAILMMFGLGAARPDDAGAQASVHYTFVEDHTGSAWPVTAAVPVVDRLVGSKLVYGKCRTGAKCIQIWESRQSGTCGLTYPPAHNTWNSGDRVRMYLASNNCKNYPVSVRQHVIMHELGHALGLGSGNWHSKSCSVMHASVVCNGSWTGSWFNSAALKRLGSN